MKFQWAVEEGKLRDRLMAKLAEDFPVGQIPAQKYRLMTLERRLDVDRQVEARRGEFMAARMREPVDIQGAEENEVARLR